ncbi:nucleotidyltransferase, partial [Verrucomicrobiales bacterium]|nr:nucleotidyltransferase [Verrucomicrobiales bacterium]
AYEKIFEYLSNVAIDSSLAEFCMVGYPLKNTLSEHGAVSRGVCSVDDNCKLLSVNELTEIHELDGVILNNSDNEGYAELTGEEIVSMNMWGFSPQIFKQLDYLFEQFLSANTQDIKSEFYIPFAVDDLIKSNSATVEVLSTDGKWFGVTYKEDKEEVEATICFLISKGDYPSKLI